MVLQDLTCQGQEQPQDLHCIGDIEHHSEDTISEDFELNSDDEQADVFVEISEQPAETR